MATLQESASYFDNGRGVRLLGVRTRALRESPGAPVVVFCHPIGEVKYSSYNAIVAFARRLAAIGISSIRFDYAGFGDSQGQTQNATITSCVADVKAAIAMIAGDDSDKRFCLVGTGLGATIAGIVAEEDTAIVGLVMIAPVVSGASFRSNLLRSQQMSFLTRGLKSPKQTDLLEKLREDGALEIKGEVFGKAFLDELSSLDLTQGGDDLPGQVLTISEPGDENSEKLADQYQQRGSRVTSWLTTSSEFWSIQPEPSTTISFDLMDRVAEWISHV
jgi:alpha/beta superfamily hydrolase